MKEAERCQDAGAGHRCPGPVPAVWAVDRRVVSVAAAAAVLALAVTGCGNSLPATVSGTITLGGQPLPESDLISGTVMFHPTAGGAAAIGSVSTGGRYDIKTGSTRGLAPGDYRVTVRVVEIEPPPPGGYQNAPGQRLLTPRRYEDREKSGLQYAVTPGKNQIDLTLEAK